MWYTHLVKTFTRSDIWLIGLLSLALGCVRQPPPPPPPPPVPLDVQQWQQRDDFAALREALSLTEAALQTEPGHRDLLARMVHGYVFIAEYHAQTEAQRMDALDEAVAWGERCLSMNADFATLRMKTRESAASAARVLTLDDAPCTFWMAVALDERARRSGLSTRLQLAPIVVAYLSQATELDPNAFYGGPDRRWGIHYANLPQGAGQDLDRARQHFDRALSIAPTYLPNHLALAQHWAVLSEDDAAVQQALDTVLNAAPDENPQTRPENRAAKQRASLMKERIAP